MARTQCIVTDLDSTVCNVEHRSNLAPQDKTLNLNWVEYSKACIDDTPNEAVVRLLQILALTFPIFVVSGRNVEAVEETQEWMRRHNVPYTEIRLHSDSDLRHNAEYKLEYIQSLRDRGYEPVLMLEDHQAVADAVTAAGVPTLLVTPPYEDSIGVSFNLQDYTDSELVGKR